jgi:predicted MFS family arabinose efflux permease
VGPEGVAPPREVSERAVVLLVAGVQFVNILDFMMVMPLGPDFSAALGIPLSRLGVVGGSYTLAAMLSGIASSTFLDRFDRRSALTASVLGLSLATAFGGLAQGSASLIAARLLAGAFGGPATSVALSIVSDLVPAERRGKAMGTVMAAFAVASVLGVPAGLELAQRGGWRLPFFAVGALGLGAALVAATLLPPLRGHFTDRAGEHAGGYRDAPDAAAKLPPKTTARALLGRGTVRLSFAMSAASMMGTFALVPNITPFLLQNRGTPRDQLGALYLFGGVCSFLALPVAGRLVDRFGGARIAAPATAVVAWVIYEGFMRARPWLPVTLVFVVWMGAMGFRNVAMQTATSKVPSAAERARFMSLQSAVQHGASSLGAMLSTAMLSQGADGRLVGVGRVAAFTVAMFATLPFALAAVERRVRAEAPKR